MNQIRESLNNVIFPDNMPDSWPYQSWCSPADIDTDITWYSFTELDLTLDAWLGQNALIPVRTSVWGFVYENEPLVQINIKDDTAFIAINRRFYSWVIIVAGTYNLNISLDLSTIFKHTALADTALCMIANRVDTQSVDVALNTAKSFMNFVFFHELVHLICSHHAFFQHNGHQPSYIRTMAFIADFLAFENSLMPLSGNDTTHKRNRDLEIGTARCLGFIIASYFIIKTKQMNTVNVYPTVNERTILLLSYILSPYLKRGEWANMLLKHEARGIMDAYTRRRKLGFNLDNDNCIISTDYATCHCNCSQCSAFATEIYTKARPLNTEVLNHMDVYTACFSKNRNGMTYPNLEKINNATSYFCGLKHPVLFSLENSIKRLI
ncbi:hypothetical protein HV011_05565 [Citrobacter freundii]|uniref:hypothetical protein n=1 Tax=Citrobacter freundii TaxID=546 RepID=UPI0015EA1CA5|nr:hypothetical protein [Citrobacter freundii]QMB05088.1 hypothetical protein HV011_05565 [Citrobacter freundii]